MFRLNRWIDGQDFIADPFAGPPVSVPQDSEQMWFAGDHSDVGGGYPEAVSGLSKFPLRWMAEEARRRGLHIDDALFEHLVLGASLPKGRFDYVPPDEMAPLHDALRGGWWILEWLPKRAKWRESRKAVLPWYLPRGERRRVPVDAVIAPSAELRRLKDPSYQPGGFF